jgi:hypothetical protein
MRAKSFFKQQWRDRKEKIPQQKQTKQNHGIQKKKGESKKAQGSSQRS